MLTVPLLAIMYTSEKRKKIKNKKKILEKQWDFPAVGI
jgi:hypothetical protein